MPRQLPSPTLLLAFVALTASTARAQAPAAKAEDLKETVSETRHAVMLGGERLEYTARAGNLLLRDDGGKPTASIFYIAYAKAGVEDLSRRPVTFTFNGGPGSSSVWLHLGAFGPKRVEMAEGRKPLPPPYRLVDNDLGLLDLTDLVFIDPVTTGFSRAAPGQDAKKFHGVEQDVEAVGEFIRLYTTRYRRWGSPKFLAGESYGTTRAAALAGHLQDRHGMNLNGVVLLSAVLNFQTIRFDEGNDLPYALFLPGYTATAWYHKKLPRELQGNLRKALAEAEEFALGDYATALLKGSHLSNGERQEVARRLARLTGLSPEYVLRSNLRVEMSRFAKELLRAEARTIGRFDSRLLGSDADSAGERSEYDPSYAAVQGGYTAALNHYLRTDLKVESDLPYEILTGKVQPWDYGRARNRYLNVADTLRQAMTKNRDLRLFVGSGYYDLATPYFAADYTVSHLGLPPDLQDHVTTAYYEAGHMMYIHHPSHRKLKKDLAAFYAAALRR